MSEMANGLVIGPSIKAEDLFPAMARQRAIDELKELQSLDDPKGANPVARALSRSCAHARADEVICRLLTILGYKDVVEEFEKIDRWYA